MYVCGPNLYAPCHVGHAMSYIIFDVLRRYLEYRGLKVRHVQNFTDIEDNIINRARAQRLTIHALAGGHIPGCSAMSLKSLGPPLDIHGGGQDLIFPHHENEIAQSESYTDDRKPFVRFWVHNGLMRLAESEEKMTRHLGNLVPIGEAIQKFGADGLRIFVLNSHYRSPITYSEESLEASKRAAPRPAGGG